MAFAPRETYSSRPPRGLGRVLAVGQRVFVNCPEERATGIVLTDDGGIRSGDRLADGTQVEILAWRPRGADGTRYRVRAADCGVDGWLAAANLRTTVEPIPAPAAAPEPPSHAPGFDPSARRFGQGR